MRPRSLRGRLTVLYAALSCVGLLALAGATVEVLWIDVREDEEAARKQGLPPPELDVEERALLYGLAVGVPIALVLAGAGGWALAGRALRPLGAITDVARAIGANDLSRRLPPGGGAEVDALAQSLNELFARLERSLDEVRRFTADAAHELRTPLTAVMGRLEVALRHPRSEAELREEMGGALEDLGRIKGLVESLLTLARSDASALGAAGAAIDLETVAAEIVERDLPLAEQRAITLSLIAGGGGARVRTRGSPQLLARALGNLVDNAVVHGRDAGRVEVRLSCAQGRARVEVADDGPGVPEADRARLFERFFRGDPSRARASTAHDGFGLGLSIARRIVEAHGGTLTYAPHDAGSVFTIELPAEPSATSTSP
ncbi:MAG TPA: ATP-binding protein [Polyangia bacterium]|nr:ATP-binding protein [Polyangia bacterium]